MARVRTAALISGRGSNLRALLEAAAEPGFPAEIALVLSNVPGAGGLQHAADFGIPAAVIDHRSYADREAFETDLDRQLRSAGIELVCLAGFMRLLTAGFVERWWDRVINIHPSLLPAFRGLNTHARALAAGVRIAGCTVHFIRPATDDGPIIVQGAVPVHPDDSPESLAARVLAVEHRCYPLALRLVAAGQARVEGDRVRLADGKMAGKVLINPGPEAANAVISP